MYDPVDTMLDVNDIEDTKSKLNIPKEVESLKVSGINASNASSYADAIKGLKLTKLSISDVSVNKRWICDIINICTTLRELNINADFSIYEFHSLLIEIDQHPRLVKLNFQMKSVLDEEVAYIDAWDKFTIFNKSLLYAKFCTRDINREDALLKSLDVKSDKCTLKSDVKLTPILANWLEYKYPDSSFWRNVSHDDKSSYSLVSSTNQHTSLIAALRDNHNSIYIKHLTPLPYCVACVSLIAFVGFFVAFILSVSKTEEFNAKERGLLAVSIISAWAAVVFSGGAPFFASSIAKCRPNPRKFEYDTEVQNSIV